VTFHPKDLIGKAEDPSLEFKAEEALDKPANIAREVVALLNARGGEIWVGVREQNGIAIELQPIPNALARRDALWNHLVDTIEPSPLSREVTVELVSTGSGGDVLTVRVHEGERGPYALLRERGRHFFVRVGARVRDMSRAEIEADFRKPRGGDKTEKIHEGILEAVTKEIDSLLGNDFFWWTLIPVPPARIDYESMSQEDKAFCKNLLTDPSASGNRRTGWTMVLDGSKLEIKTSGIEQIYGEPPFQHQVTIDRQARATFRASRSRLDRNWRPDGIEIFPFALIELPVSSFRIMARFIDRFMNEAHPSKLVVAAVIGKMKGARLRPGSPSVPTLPWQEDKTFSEADLVVPPFDVDIATEEFGKNPDAAAYRLVLRIYEQFGFQAEDIPAEFSPADRSLRFGGG